MSSGTGTELKKLFASVGIVPALGCHCLEVMRDMNEWGPQGCRQRFAMIVTSIENDAAKYNWAVKLNAARETLMKGLAFKVNWFNPIPGFVEEAIRISEIPSVQAAPSGLVPLRA